VLKSPKEEITMTRQIAFGFASFGLTAVLIFVSGTQGMGFYA
jgi:hypothetical protein